MARKNYNLNEEELAQIEHAIQNSEQPEVRQRAKAIHLLHSGEKPSKVAEMTAVGVSTIYNWHKRWRAEGIEGLRNKPKSGGGQIETKPRISKAKELLGKWVTIRAEPHVRGEAVDRIEPHSLVQFLEIVPDKNKPEWEWLKLDENHYVNYDYPPNGLRFKLLPDEPELPIDHYVLTAYNADHNVIQRKVLVELK